MQSMKLSSDGGCPLSTAFADKSRENAVEKSEDAMRTYVAMYATSHRLLDRTLVACPSNGRYLDDPPRESGLDCVA